MEAMSVFGEILKLVDNKNKKLFKIILMCASAFISTKVFDTPDLVA